MLGVPRWQCWRYDNRQQAGRIFNCFQTRMMESKMKWKEVTNKEMFYAFASTNVTPHIITENYPYSVDFRTRTGAVVGKIVSSYITGNVGLTQNKYYLPERGKQ